MVCIVPKITPILLEQSHAQGLQMAPYELIIPLISSTSRCLYDIHQPQYKQENLLNLISLVISYSQTHQKATMPRQYFQGFSNS